MANQTTGSNTTQARRIAVAGAGITGLFGIILGINAMLGDNEIGAGVLLAASALAFGLLAIAVFREEE